MHKYYINKILKSNNIEKIMLLQDLMIDVISYMETLDPIEYEEIECELYEICEGKVLSEDKAKHIINSMKPYGMHWTLQETEEIRKANNLNNLRDIDFWVVMNSAYNDYHNLFSDNLDMYIKFSKYFILDEDANESKVYTYFTKIPKK